MLKGWKLSRLVLAFTFLVAAHVPAAYADTLADLIKGAKKETTFKAQWSSSTLNGSKGLKKIIGRINKKYGLNLKPKFTPGPNMQRMMGKIQRELKAGQPASSDVYTGNAQAMLDAMKAKTTPVKSIKWADLLERPLKSEPGFNPIVTGGIGIAFASTLVGVTYNSDMVKGDDIPRILADTLKSKWKGKIASTPYAAGMREFSMPDLLGREAMREYTKKLSKQIAGLMRCGEMDRITSGEFLMLVLSCGDQYVNLAQRRGVPLGYAVMNDATISHTRYFAVPKNSGAPNAAALFAAYIHTVEGQKLLWDIDGYDLHLYPESHQKKKLDKARAAGAKIAINTPEWLGSFKGYRKNQKALQKILKNK
jgi:ABC-type Fe3+ transport system substrate-binding protein